MGKLRSSTSTEGRLMAGARSLWRATGMSDNDFGKPIIAIVNSFTQFVPGHVHLKDVGQQVKAVIDECGGFGVEFNTIAIDDGIAMGHNGMLYSLPSRDLIADSVEYMVNAHCADAMICISNCDKITPGMLMAAMRVNIPSIFVSGGPMEAGESDGHKLDLIDAMTSAGDESFSDKEVKILEQNACPTCGSCSGMFTANSMNCLNEAIGMALPGNGTVVATHKKRWDIFKTAAARIVEMAKQYYFEGDSSVLPRSIATRESFKNAMTLDIAMGGSTNTVLHILAVAREAEAVFTLQDIDEISRNVPTLTKVAPSSHYHIEDVHRAGGIMAILEELSRRDGILDTSCIVVSGMTLAEQIEKYGFRYRNNSFAEEFYKAAPGGVRTIKAFSQDRMYESLDTDNRSGCIRSLDNAYSQDGGLCVLYGNIAKDGCIVKTAGVDESLFKFKGPARVFESQDDACKALLGDMIKAGDVVLIRYEGPKGGPGMQEMLYPTTYIKSKHLGKECALITDGRFSGGTSGLSICHISPEAAAGGNIGLVEEGDLITIDIPNRKIDVDVSVTELNVRREKMKNKGDEAWKPVKRARVVSEALKAYAAMTTSADKGAIRDISQLR